MPSGSTVYWSCDITHSWPDYLDVPAIILSFFSLAANLVVTVLLFRLRAKTITDLALLRLLSISCLISSFISLVDDVITYDTMTGNRFFDSLICLLWNSRFIYWLFLTLVVQSLVFFVCNRAINLLHPDHRRITTENQLLTVYMLTVVGSSLLIMAPQLLMTRLDREDCDCAPAPENIPLLSVVFAHAYLWFLFLAIIYPTVLVYICSTMLLRVLRGNREPLVDDLDAIYFPNGYSSSATDVSSVSSTAALQLSVVSDEQGTKDDDDEVSQVTWSASFCIVPLTAAYIATFTYDATYQFLSAAGKLSYVLRSPAQQFSEVLLILFTALVPLILFFHIPAMRSLIFVAIASLRKRCSNGQKAGIGESYVLQVKPEQGTEPERLRE
nr:unnamed protein product [Spirometra erinaceieuropaei]